MRRDLTRLSIAWVIVAIEAVHASSRPTYQEFRLGLAPVIEWPRVVFVWVVLAAELLAFGALVRVLASTESRAERATWIAGGVAAAVALSLTVRSHGPEELNSPGRVALLLVVAGAAMGLYAGVRSVVARFRRSA